MQIAADDDGMTEDSEFPSLATQQSASWSSHQQQREKKSRPKGTLLLSTALPASSSASGPANQAAAPESAAWPTLNEVTQRTATLQIQPSTQDRISKSRSSQKLDESAYPSLPAPAARSTSSINLAAVVSGSSHESLASGAEDDAKPADKKRGKKLLIRFG